MTISCSLATSYVGVDIAKSFSYNTIGNILIKSDVGTYAYPEPGQPFPHAVASISGSVVNTTFAYDANGNQTAGNGLTLTYASFNKPATIARGSALIAFAHDTEHQRYKQMNPTGETLYLAGSGVMAERLLGAGGVVQWTNYLSAGGEMVAMRVDRSDATTYTRYFHKDHLGSIATITDAAGAVVERLSYDAWGKRRFPNGQDDPSGSVTSQTTRGFTGHEQLADVGLIHMNGRVYDPMLGRFGTPDPMTENPYDSQGWNRYTYVGNSPLNFTDPSGYCWAGCFWQKPFKALGGLLRKFPIIGQIIQAAAIAVICVSSVGSLCAGAVAVISSAVTTGLASGSLGQALRAGLITAATAAAFSFAGDITAGLGPVPKIAAHAAIGCGSAVASGGKCGAGALSAGVPALAGSVLPEIGVQDNIVVRASIGGLASVAGGGKFGNGAVTAAFAYLFNEMAHCTRDPMGCGDPIGPPRNWGVAPIGLGVGVYIASQWEALADWGQGLWNSAAEALSDLTGKTREEAHQTLTDDGFVHKGTTVPGGYEKYYHPDGSRVQIRSDGEVVRTGPKVQDPNPNERGYRPRIGPDGMPTDSHNTGERVK